MSCSVLKPNIRRMKSIKDFDRCVFAQTWIDAGEEKYGRIYCENIDPAIVKTTMRIWNASMTTSCTKMGIALSVLEKKKK